jgi:hypothetical protein
VAAAAPALVWWDEEEADGELIRVATEEAAAAQWAAWRGSDAAVVEEEGVGADGTSCEPRQRQHQQQQQQQQQQPAWEAAASEGQRGAWSYCVGLVSAHDMGTGRALRLEQPHQALHMADATHAVLPGTWQGDIYGCHKFVCE